MADSARMKTVVSVMCSTVLLCALVPSRADGCDVALTATTTVSPGDRLSVIVETSGCEALESAAVFAAVALGEQILFLPTLSPTPAPFSTDVTASPQTVLSVEHDGGLPAGTYTFFAVVAAADLSVLHTDVRMAQVTVDSGGSTEPFAVTSSDIPDGGTVPDAHVRSIGNQSPMIAWNEPPSGTSSFVVICDDPDAPGGTWNHWTLFNLPASARSIAADQPRTGALANGATQGLNSWSTIGYEGPQPPAGTGAHRYVFTVYALDTTLSLDSTATSADVYAAMTGHILGQTSVTGTYEQ